jgi:hypothetical protein
VESLSKRKLPELITPSENISTVGSENVIGFFVNVNSSIPRTIGKVSVNCAIFKPFT